MRSRVLCSVNRVRGEAKMKRYETPDMELVKLLSMDIISTSGPETNNDDETGNEDIDVV